MKLLRNQKGFTLIELLVVVIIVSVLAAIGIPLLSGNVERARMAEAESGLGAVRTAMRAHFSEQGAAVGYSDITADTEVVAANVGINAGDLTGRFFEDDDYVIASADVDSYCVGVTGDDADGATAATTAKRGDQVAGLSRSMDEQGTIYDDATCTGTALNNAAPAAEPAP